MIEMFEPNDLKLRPTVRSPKCSIRKLSQLIDIILKSCLPRIKNFIHDSFIFLFKYTRDLDEETEIVTFDVISQDTSYPREFDLELSDYFLTKYQKDLHPTFKTEFVSESVNFILEKNTLIYDAEFYLQIKGRTMPTIFAPTYANLIMGYYEIKAHSIILQNYALASKNF